MKIKFFNKDEHYGIVLKWWEKVQTQPSTNLPPTGVIVFDDDDNALSAGWILNTDFTKAIFWDFISNPDIRKGRNESIDLLIKALEEYAMRKGYEGMLGMSKIDRLLKRSLNHGYQVTKDSYTLIEKEL